MISPNAFVKTEKIGHNVVIHDAAVIRENVIMGNNVIIHPHVVIESGVTIEDNVEIFPGSYLGKEPKGAGALARQPEFNKQIVIGKNCSLGPHAVIFYDVVIGEHTLIGDGASIREKCTIGKYCIISRHVTINYNTQIGDRTKIMDLSHMTGNMLIGNDVFISTMVSTTNDNDIGVTRTYNAERMKGPIVEDNASIGAGAILLPGVTIGRGALVGAGSVVTKNIKEFTLAIGIPARFVRQLNI